ncbi:4-alpha-glucanotransferase [Butyricicoccus sp. Marseille-Q5471]|uniref:4-alpha-glucanotransferase n=1 Tax=Butyricicoccus sp. Marseille-Q5471 TaxID=3039493 RepID=UPI0024BC70CC|nr:4-alpha-glucanotransferase [Butyricicoccus sp. Marseille-Q5471]
MRTSGILLHITSLPSRWGVGTLGAEARAFVDRLHEAGQTFWQILPVGPTGYGDSPYQSFSTFAGNPYLIDLDTLCDEHLLAPAEYQTIDWGQDAEHVDFGLLYQHRFEVLDRACSRLLETENEDFDTFCTENADWLEDYALFFALKTAHGGAPWSEWELGLRFRERQALEAARLEHAYQMSLCRAAQYLFFRQWAALKTYANGLGVRIIGDLPIYVSADSADVWANPGLFQLDASLRPTEVAGVPPDGFTDKGQLWGNPLFDWDAHAREGYSWWISRVRRQFDLFDVLRIDHFRGFDTYYAVPAGDADAKNGRWRQGPGMELFRALHDALGARPIIAEDLGYLTDSVRRLLLESGFPGMKLLQFAFDSREDSDYLPHNYTKNCVVYAGTHDNDTINGWMQTAPSEDAAFARAYLRLTAEEGWNWGVMRAVWASAGDTAIVTMQDVLGLGSEARMNTPSTLGGNWTWRMRPGAFTETLTRRLYHDTALYRRLPPDASKEESK